MSLDKREIVQLYRKRAEHYNLSANLYYLLGFREQAYRKKAVKALNLKPGDIVVEIGCGTGLNFPLLQREIGPSGKIIGVDLTDDMLDQARRRVTAEGWSNVELVQADAAAYQFPKNVNGIISTFAITLVPEYDQVIKNGVGVLSPGGRFVILDIKKPENKPMWLIRLGVYITKPFGISLDLTERHPWESVSRYLTNTSFTELYMGFAYISIGEAAAG